MIVEKIITIGTKQFKHTKSDEDKCILQQETGVIYEEAIDVLESNYTYIETDRPITIFDEE